MNVNVPRSCGHYTEYPCNPSSEARAEIEAGQCEACWRRDNPKEAARLDAEMEYLDAEGQRLLAEDAEMAAWEHARNAD